MNTLQKTLCVALLAMAGSVLASPIAYINNKSGGRIVITSERGKTCTSDSRLAYATTETNRTIMGCWAIDSLYIHILWNDGDIRSYPLENWEFIKSDKKGSNL